MAIVRRLFLLSIKQMPAPALHDQRTARVIPAILRLDSLPDGLDFGARLFQRNPGPQAAHWENGSLVALITSAGPTGSGVQKSRPPRGKLNVAGMIPTTV
ncbi:MAG: hypothetical protein DMG57_05255 [Acidobacteria bacterium]|nr:MAG: hypothetical protein DMG57_05255 [Acidobacteriota bacterium]